MRRRDGATAAARPILRATVIIFFWEREKTPPIWSWNNKSSFKCDGNHLIQFFHLFWGQHVILKIYISFFKETRIINSSPCSGSGFYGVTKINVKHAKIYLFFFIDWGRLPTGTSGAIQSAPARVRGGSESLSESPRRGRRREAGRRRRRPRCKLKA